MTNFNETSAISWANLHIKFDEKALVHERPWSSVWRLSEKGEIYYLKHIKRASNFEVRTLEWLSKIIPCFIPEVVVNHENKGFLLLKEVKGRKAESFLDVMIHYGKLQYVLLGSAKRQLFHKKIDTNNLAAAFLYEVDKYNAKNDLGYKHSYSYEKFVRKLEIDKSIPYTINHCDIQCDHLIMVSEDKSIFLDWSDAVYGPLFMSFVSAFGAIKTLQMVANLDEEIELFIEQIRPIYNISHKKLIEYLPSILLTGLIYHWLDFNFYNDDYSQSQMQIIEDEIFLLMQE